MESFKLTILVIVALGNFTCAQLHVQEVQDAEDINSRVAKILKTPMYTTHTEPYAKWEDSVFGKHDVFQEMYLNDQSQSVADHSASIQQSKDTILKSAAYLRQPEDDRRRELEEAKLLLADGQDLLEDLIRPIDHKAYETLDSKNLKTKQKLWFNLKTFLLVIKDWFERFFTFTAFRKEVSSEKKVESAYRYLRRIKKFKELDSESAQLIGDTDKVILQVLDHEKGKNIEEDEGIDKLAVELARTNDIEKIKNEELRELALEQKESFEQAKPEARKFWNEMTPELQKLEHEMVSQQLTIINLPTHSVNLLEEHEKHKHLLARLATRALKNLLSGGGNWRKKEAEGKRRFLKKLSDACQSKVPTNDLSQEEQSLLDHFENKILLNLPKQLKDYEKAYLIMSMNKSAREQGILNSRSKFNVKNKLKRKLYKNLHKHMSTDQFKYPAFTEAERRWIDRYAAQFDAVSSMLEPQGLHALRLFQLDLMRTLPSSSHFITQDLNSEKLQAIREKMRVNNLDMVDIQTALKHAQKSMQDEIRWGVTRKQVERDIISRQRTGHILSKPEEELLATLSKSRPKILAAVHTGGNVLASSNAQISNALRGVIGMGENEIRGSLRDGKIVDKPALTHQNVILIESISSELFFKNLFEPRTQLPEDVYQRVLGELYPVLHQKQQKKIGTTKIFQGEGVISVDAIHHLLAYRTQEEVNMIANIRRNIGKTLDNNADKATRQIIADLWVRQHQDPIPEIAAVQASFAKMKADQLKYKMKAVKYLINKEISPISKKDIKRSLGKHINRVLAHSQLDAKTFEARFPVRPTTPVSTKLSPRSRDLFNSLNVDGFIIYPLSE
ncbi:hypothetical protein CROQUDRAFT_88773 [Cronartium quercuum f. sp. fusiforme G11]|uniref:Uncharacterized protein n=1 Tax=Cronartium quercuum f. sp. fusiforme G11 TaxID=708437 RepID=A0A9P6NUF4_9BASI|nr:hypothetical protein CROQUDRAFT_88773 [Cronartium quercuum f. sp. fusiforme G11]